MLPCQKPKKKRQPPVKVYRDGREVCNMATVEGRRIYKERTEEMECRQNFKCAICGLVFLVMTFDHEAGRGGGKQDDRILDEKGEWQNAALCLICNGLKGSRRYKWIGGEYLPVTKYKEEAA